MVSPYRRSENSRASPARHTNGLHRSHRDSFNPTSSSTLLDELSQLLIDDDRAFRKDLDAQSLKQQKLHVDALEKALAQHEAVRRSAEQMHEKIQIEIEAERKRQEAEAQRQLDEARRKAAEEEQQREEERQAREVALKRQQAEAAQRAAAKKQQQEEAEQARQKAAKEKAQAERQAREQADAQRAAQQEKAEAEKHAAARAAATTPAAPQAQAASSQANGIGAAAPAIMQSTQAAPQPLPTGVITDRPEREATHHAYREIHKRLKQVRARVKELGDKDPNFRELMAGARREIGQTIGQLNMANKTINAQKTRKVKAILDTAIKMDAPMVNGSLFLHPAPEGQIDVPLTFIYVVNVFAKKILASLESEVQCKPAVERAACADPMGIMVAQIFAVPEFHVKDRSLIDILWAKLHVACPMLFGLPYAQGQKGIKAGVVSAFGAGFAAITLRDFSNTVRRNPAPNRMFWEAIARILNMPSPMQGRSQYEILTSFLSPGFVERFIKFYGQAAIAVLKKALDEFPKWVLENSENQQGKAYPLRKYATALQAMKAHLDTELHLSL